MKPTHQLIHLLKHCQINYQHHYHQAVFTTDEAHILKETISGAHSKNLFLKSEKGRFYLVTLLDDQQLDLKTFGKEFIGARLSFAKPNDLLQYLNVTPGAVSPFGLMFDTTGAVTFYLEHSFLPYDYWNFHPLENDQTLQIKQEDCLQFLDHIQHKPIIAGLPLR